MQRRPNVVRTSAIASCDSFVLATYWRHLCLINYWIDARQHGIYLLRRRNTRYKNPQLVAQHYFVVGFGSMFLVFHLARSTCRATKTIVAGWRNATHWLVDLLAVDPRQVAGLMKNEHQRQNLLLKVDPRSTYRNNFLQPATNISVARQVDHAM